MNVYCNKCGKHMIITNEDSRQEWYEATYGCEDCNTIKIHTQEFDQNGLVTLDEITDGKL